MFLIFFCLILCSCKKSTDNVDISDKDNLDNTTYIGIDFNGKYKSCQEISNSVGCTEIFGPEEEYAQECERQGQTVITCDCHDYICVSGNSTGSATGTDIDGIEKTCPPVSSDLVCTMVFTPGDQYALDCVELGGIAFQCGCHDYICLNLE